MNFLPIMLNPNLSGQDVKELIELDTEMRLRRIDVIEERALRLPKDKRIDFLSRALPFVFR